MTIEQANQYFAALPEGFAPAEELRAALPAAAQQVAYVGVAGTAGKTAAAALTAAVLQAAGFVTGLYRAGCEPLEQRVRIVRVPVVRVGEEVVARVREVHADRRQQVADEARDDEHAEEDREHDVDRATTKRQVLGHAATLDCR